MSELPVTINQEIQHEIVRTIKKEFWRENEEFRHFTKQIPQPFRPFNSDEASNLYKSRALLENYIQKETGIPRRLIDKLISYEPVLFRDMVDFIAHFDVKLPPYLAERIDKDLQIAEIDEFDDKTHQPSGVTCGEDHESGECIKCKICGDFIPPENLDAVCPVFDSNIPLRNLYEEVSQ